MDVYINPRCPRTTNLNLPQTTAHSQSHEVIGEFGTVDTATHDYYCPLLKRLQPQKFPRFFKIELELELRRALPAITLWDCECAVMGDKFKAVLGRRDLSTRVIRLKVLASNDHGKARWQERAHCRKPQSYSHFAAPRLAVL